MASRVRIGILGAGTVGGAVHDLIVDGHLARFGVEAEVVKVFTRSPESKTRYRVSPELFTTDATAVIGHPDVDIVVEVLGAGSPEDLRAQKDWVVDALRNGKSVVTANKALLVAHGEEIWATARECGRAVRFEACVGGGIPIIGPLTQSLSAERPSAVYGLLNGTSNYILTEMSQRSRSYGDALASAQALGYAEADPDADVSGRDAEAKLLLLSSVTFGARLQPGVIHRKGIERIHAIDFLYAERKGRSTIKSVALARNVDGALEAMVTPMMVPERHPIAGIHGVTNALFFKGEVSDGGGARRGRLGLRVRRPGCRRRGHGGGRPWRHTWVGGQLRGYALSSGGKHRPRGGFGAFGGRAEGLLLRSFRGAGPERHRRRALPDLRGQADQRVGDLATGAWRGRAGIARRSGEGRSRARRAPPVRDHPRRDQRGPVAPGPGAHRAKGLRAGRTLVATYMEGLTRRPMPECGGERGFLLKAHG